MTIRMDGIRFTMVCECCGVETGRTEPWSAIGRYVTSPPVADGDFEEACRRRLLALAVTSGQDDDWTAVRVDDLCSELCPECASAYKSGAVTPVRRVFWTHEDSIGSEVGFERSAGSGAGSATEGRQ